MRKIRWGILGAAKIGITKVIPAMQQGKYCDVIGIASRKLETAQAAAKQLGIQRSYDSYEKLLADPDIDAVYIPLPNHLHVPWTIKALEQGKHVLCEKPMGLNVAEVEKLYEITKKYPSLKVMEAFMYRHHPQWHTARQIVVDGEIGELKTIQSFFSYFNDDPNNIRNRAEVGGGGLMDIGCYCISLSRFIFGAEPDRVYGVIDNDPKFGVDRLASAIMQFEQGTSIFTCGTQLSPYQRVNIIGTEGRVEIEIPFNAPADQPCKMWHQRGSEIEEIIFDVCDQYTIQADVFSRAILDDTEVPTPLGDAIANMKVIEALKNGTTGGIKI